MQRKGERRRRKKKAWQLCSATMSDQNQYNKDWLSGMTK